LHPVPFAAVRIYTVVFWIAFGLWIVPELIASALKRSADSSMRRDRGSLRLISFLWCVGLIAGFSLSEFLPSAAISSQRNFLFFVGVCLMVSVAAFRWYSAGLLGKYFTFDVAVESGHELIEAGPYRYIRHPSYTGALLSLLGFGLALGNWAGLAAAVGCLGIAYAYRIPVEEAALASALGENYVRYRKRTWRLVPFLF
jgi:protein-S-isoprenylcysteine O-methyltransferase Ste14